VKKTYAYHKPSISSLDKITKLREAFSKLDDLILEIAPRSREASIAITNLETAAMWAIKAVVSNDPESIADIAPTTTPGVVPGVGD
jgi:hypothetical protein